MFSRSITASRTKHHLLLPYMNTFKVWGYLPLVNGWTFKVYSISTRPSKQSLILLLSKHFCFSKYDVISHLTRVTYPRTLTRSVIQNTFYQHKTTKFNCIQIQNINKIWEHGECKTNPRWTSEIWTHLASANFPFMA